MPKKHAKEAVAKVRSMGAQVTLEQGTGGGHYKLTATYSSVTVNVPVSSSPADEKSCVNMVAQMVRRRFAERGVLI